MSEAQIGSEKREGLYLWGAALAVIGLLLSLYATFHHVDVLVEGSTDAACNISQTFNCDDIARSEYSEIMGFPLGIYGLGFFGGLLLLLGTAFFKRDFEEDNLLTYVYLTGLGTLLSVGLFILSWVAVGVVCPTCVGIYLTCFAQTIISFVYRNSVPLSLNFKGLGNGATYPVTALAAAAICYSFLKPTPHNFKRDDPQVDLASIQEAQQMISDLSILDSEIFEIPLNRSAYSGLGEDYRQGGENAKVVIVKFGDFECPSCRRAYLNLNQLKKEFGDQILVTFRNFPLDNSCNNQISRKLHEWACDASILTRCAGRKGRFWQLHDLIYENQRGITTKKLTEMAKSVGLSDGEIKECRQSKDIMAKIKDDISLGEKVGVTGTPTLYINGRKVLKTSDTDGIRRTILNILGGP